MELKKAQIITLKKYKFDRIMRYNNQYYLMKVDEPFKLLLWLIPFLEWLLPHKFYLIDKRTAQNLIFTPQERNHPHDLIISFTMMFGSSIAAWLVAHSINLAIAPLSAIIIEIIAALGFRYFLSTLSIVKNYQKNTLVYQGFLFPEISKNSKSISSVFLFFIVGGFFSLGGMSGQLHMGANLIIVIFTMIILEIYLMGNAVALIPGEFYLFKFKLLADNTKKQITSKEIN